MRQSKAFLALAVGAGFLFAACSASPASQAPAETTDVRLQLQWVPQAQFAGYFAAAGEGYYEDEGLNVTFVPASPDIAPHGRAPPRTGPSSRSRGSRRSSRPQRHPAVGPREHRPGLPAIGHAVSVVDGLEHHESGRLRGQEGRRGTSATSSRSRRRLARKGSKPARTSRRSSSRSTWRCCCLGTSTSPRR